MIREINEVLRTGDSMVLHEVEVTDPSGRGRVVRNHRSALPLDATGGVSAVLTVTQDITELKRVESALRRRAMYDSLTALPNRLLFLERLVHALQSMSRRGASRVGLLFCDVDSFKQVNDTHGHLVGDQVLVGVAARLRQAVRPQDTVARFGGDEFAVLVSRVPDHGTLNIVAARLQEAMKAPLEAAGEVTSLPVTLSVGGSLAEQADIRAETLLEAADRAMYRAKRRGPGQIEIEGFEPTDSGADRQVS